MSSRKIYIIAVLLLLVAVFAMAQYKPPESYRYEQHIEEARAAAEDTNLSVRPGTFSTHLPVVSIDTGGKKIPGDWVQGEMAYNIFDKYANAQVRVIDANEGLNTLQTESQVDTRAWIRIRGNTSREFPKDGYLMKFVDSEGADNNLEVLGMEADSTWVLNGPYLDKTLMRNYMWYNLSGKIMDWAPDVRYCEVFINNKYQGVYVLMEQISVGEGRVEISKYDKRTKVSSYILSSDREGVNSTDTIDSFTDYAYRRGVSSFEIKYPASRYLDEELTEYIEQDVSDFEKALYSFDYTDEIYGYENHIDVQNFVDYFIINEVAGNIDAGEFSTYIYKDVTGKFKLAVWDFNNVCDNYPAETVTAEGFVMIEKPWYYMLCKDDKFNRKIIRRYKELRKDILSDEAVTAYIEDVQNYLGAAKDRNFKVWGDSFIWEKDGFMDEKRHISSYEEAVVQYETWLFDRLHWLDEYIESLRYYSHESKTKKFNH